MSSPLFKGFLALPPELRNQVYELAFVPNARNVNLHEAQAAAPSKSLLLASRQLHNESAQYYYEAYILYWRNSRFVIDRRLHNVTMEHIQELDLTGIENIQHLKIITKVDGTTEKTIMLSERGLWKHTRTRDPRITDRVGQQRIYSGRAWWMPSRHVRFGLQTAVTGRKEWALERLVDPDFCLVSMQDQICEILRLYDLSERRSSSGNSSQRGPKTTVP